MSNPSMRKHHVTLSESDRHTLTTMAKDTSLTVKKHRRIVSLLALDSGSSYREVIKAYGSTAPTLLYLVRRYQEFGLSCLNDKKRSGRPPVISGEQRAKLTALACSKAPIGHAKWTLRMLADKAVELDICPSISHNHVSQILKKTHYSPISNARGVSVK